MSRKYNIKWRDKDKKEIARIVKNYNAKLKRIVAKHPEDAKFLPSKVSMKQLKDKISTRADFNRELKSLARFSKHGAEKLITKGELILTKYEIKETKLKVRIVNLKRSIERKKLNTQKYSGVEGQMEERNLLPKKFSFKKSEKEWEKFVGSLEREIGSMFKEKLLEQYKTNYIEALIKNLGEKGEALAKILEGLDAETLYRKSITNPLLTIDFIYDPIEIESIITAKTEIWEKELLETK